MQTRQMALKKESGFVAFEHMNADSVRQHVLHATRDFKNAWRNLAGAIYLVKQEKLYIKWGFQSFDQYIAKEVGIRQNTAVKLIRSYLFLKNEEPHYLKSDSENDNPTSYMPSLEAVSTLQRARKNLDDTDYMRFKADLMEKGRDVHEVKKDLTQLILKRRKDVDPEKERVRRNKESIRRFISALSAFKQEIKLLHILPHEIALDIDLLIDKIEHISPQKP